MGLDMYLYSRKNGARKTNVKEVAYWRKANAIHGWFVNHCTDDGNLDDCEEIEISKNNIEALKQDCLSVLEILGTDLPKETISVNSGWRFENGKAVDVYEDCTVYSKEQRDKVCEILPPTPGFFFGSYNIDEWYKSEIENTAKICDEILSTINFDTHTLIYSAWW